MSIYEGPRLMESTVALITGGTAGIGLACANGLHQQGATVILVARQQEGLDRCQQRFGERVHVIQADVGTAPGCRAISDRINKEQLTVNLLINNAGLHHRGPFGKLTDDMISSMVDVNLKAPMRLSHELLPMLTEQRGTIVNVASLAGCIPLAGSAAYSATKFGLRAWSLAMADELKDTGVTVCCISPGPVKTHFILSHLESVTDLTLSQPMVEPEAVARAILEVLRTKKRDVCIPSSSGRLAKLGYLFPSIRRVLKPVMERRGRRARKALEHDEYVQQPTGDEGP